MISSLGHIGKTGAERELMLATNLAVTLLGTLGVLAVRTRLEEASQAARRSLKAIAKILVTMERKDLLIIMEKADQYSRNIEAAMKKIQ